MKAFLDFLLGLFAKKSAPAEPPIPPWPVLDPPFDTSGFPIAQFELEHALVMAGASSKVDVARIATALRISCLRFGITSIYPIAHLIAHLAHESGGFLRTVESMVYSPQRLVAVFKTRVTADIAAQIAGNEYATAERVYGYRADLGNTVEGDGYKHRGLFWIQLTGKANQTLFASYMGLTVDQLWQARDDAQLNADASCWYCTRLRHGFIDAANANDLRATTRIVNGELNGYDDRAKRLAAVFNALGLDQR